VRLLTHTNERVRLAQCGFGRCCAPGKYSLPLAQFATGPKSGCAECAEGTYQPTHLDAMDQGGTLTLVQPPAPSSP
jgi:hypothetical protein